MIDVLDMSLGSLDVASGELRYPERRGRRNGVYDRITQYYRSDELCLRPRRERRTFYERQEPRLNV